MKGPLLEGFCFLGEVREEAIRWQGEQRCEGGALEGGRGVKQPSGDWKRSRVRALRSAVRRVLMAGLLSGPLGRHGWAADRARPGLRFCQEVPWRASRAKELRVFTER